MSQDRSNSAIEAQIEVLKEKKSQAECSGTENEAKASSVAPEGGGKGEALRFCPNCRWKAHEGDKFCGQCGRSLIR